MHDGELSRVLGLRTLILMGVGAVVGAGIFVVTGQVAATHAGPAIVLSFGIAAVVCLFSAFCYAEMAGMLPHGGSAYAFAKEAFGGGLAWIVGWALIAEYLFASSVIAIGWSGYVQSVIADMGITLPDSIARSPIAFDGARFSGTGAVLNLPAVVAVALVTGSHLFGLRNSVRFNTLTVLIKFSAIAVFVVFGLLHAVPENWTPFIPAVETAADGSSIFGWPGVLAAAGMVFFAFLGFDVMASTALEARNPQRDLPRTIVATLVISTLLYILVAITMTGLLDFHQLNTDAPVATALAAAGPSLAWVKTYVAVAVSIGLWAGLWAAAYAASRLLYLLAADGLLPQALTSVSTKNRIPVRAVLAMGAIGALMGAFMPIALLGEIISTGTLLAFAVVCAAVFVLRQRQPERERPFRIPLGRTVAMLGIITSLGLIASMGSGAIMRILAWQALGIPVVLLSLRRRA